MSNERTWNGIGMLLGVVVILLGIFFCTTPAESSGTDYTEYASFGADFYTYEYKATRAAAANAAATAHNIDALNEKAALYAGFAFIVAGMLIVLHYGKLFCCQRQMVTEAPPAAMPAIAAAPPVEAPAPQEPALPVQDPPVQQKTELEKYQELLEAGVITQEELDALKERL